MHVGLLSYRIAGIDGVSLELERWKVILERMGHKATMIAGELDRTGYLVPLLHFNEPRIYDLHLRAISNGVPFHKLQPKIFKMIDIVETELNGLFERISLDRLVTMNVFSLPIHLALAAALHRVILRRSLLTFSRNPDFWWERDRYASRESFREFFQRYFPPRDNRYLKHITSNTIAQKTLKDYCGLDSIVFGDCFDYNHETRELDGYAGKWRNDFGIGQEDLVFLQATRIVPRKQIELSIELVKTMKDERVVLVLAGYSGDEGDRYVRHLKRLIEKYSVRAVFIGDRVGARRVFKHGRRIYTLWDCFMNCDFVTYPSAIEGFGNQFLEAIHFKKPILVNRYEVYKADLEPLGFNTVAINNGKISTKTINDVKEVLTDVELRRKMVDTNLRIAQKHFSFEATEKKLQKLGF